MASAGDTTGYRRARALVCDSICAGSTQGPPGPQGVPGSIGSTAIGSYYYDSTIAVGNTTSTVMQYNGTFYQRYVSVTSTTKITVAKTAVYEATYSIQIHRTSGGSPVFVYIWLRKNGVDVPNSNGRVQINSNNGDSLPIVPYIIDLNAGDYLEFMVQATDTDVQLLSINPGIGPFIPAIIVGIKEIG
jgi:hypothetical protein